MSTKEQLETSPQELVHPHRQGFKVVTLTSLSTSLPHLNRKHTGEKPFLCRCGRKFSRLDNVGVLCRAQSVGV